MIPKERVISVLALLLCMVALFGCDGEDSKSEDPTKQEISGEAQGKTEKEEEGRGTDIVLSEYVYVTYCDADGFIADDVYYRYPGADEVFCPFATVFVQYGESERVEERGLVKSKQDGEAIFYRYVVQKLITAKEMSASADGEIVFDKPVIYLYPEQACEVRVELLFDGVLIKTIPAYEAPWVVKAMPDGTLHHHDGQTYPYLFWEGIPNAALAFEAEYCIAGADTGAFLQSILPRLGLNERECADFIEYWLPRMEDNAYNLISFDTMQYESMAPLRISPSPDSMLRVFMSYRASNTHVSIVPPAIKAFERRGFAVVEWGGCELK